MKDWWIEWSNERFEKKSTYGIEELWCLINICFQQKLSVSHHILYFAIGGGRAVKVDWAEPCRRDGIWLKLSHCSRAKLILGRQSIYRKRKTLIISDSGTIWSWQKLVIVQSLILKLNVRLTECFPLNRKPNHLIFLWKNFTLVLNTNDIK